MKVSNNDVTRGSSPRRATLYARVSTDEQAEKGYSLPSQVEAMREYAARNGMQVIRELQDDYSGAKLDRPGLDELRAMIERKEVDAIIVFAADRLSRNLAHLLILREEFDRAGVELHYVNRGKSDNTAESRLTENIEGVIAEFEREKIKERTRRGKTAKAKAGKWVGCGVIPYGFRKVGAKQDSRLEINESEAQIKRRVFDMYLGRNGYMPTPIKAIARELDAEGVPPPGRGRGPGHSGGRSTSRGWWTHAIHSILDRLTCVGIFEYGGVTLDFPELAIIDRETYEAVQARRKRNKELSKRNRKYPYLFAGYAKCTCGGRMSGDAVGEKRRYYACARRIAYAHLRDCNEPAVRVEVFEGLVWDWLVGLLTDDSKLDKGIREYVASRATESSRARERIAMIEEMIERADKRMERLAKDLDEMESDSARAAIRKEMNTIGKEKDGLIAERDKSQAEIGKREVTEADCEYIKKTASMIRRKLNGNPTYEEKRALFDAIDLTIEMQHNGQGRVLFVTCGLSMKGAALPLEEGKRATDPIVSPAC